MRPNRPRNRIRHACLGRLGWRGVPDAVPRHGAPRLAFTLVEMLVAVGLVVLMMTLFATIFQMATQTMGTQRGLTENDQRVRLVSNVLRTDLARRTMQEVAPFAANESSNAPGARFERRQGYFYIREGDPNDDTDDILQFTASVNTGEEPFYGVIGKRVGPSQPLQDLLFPDWQGRYQSNPPNVQYWQNQPEFDDGAITINHVTSSPNAEIAYFLRNGVLYRRVLLIRKPTVGNLNEGTPRRDEPNNPSPGTGADLDMSIFGSSGNRNFLTDTDFSASWDATSGLVVFHGSRDLNNARNVSSSLVTLGNPRYRFGHNIADGIPREDVQGFFIGRFTHEETSYFDPADPARCFGYPGKVTPNSGKARNPYASDNGLTYDPEAGVVNEYRGGWRAGEDVLMTNVHRFDIKVWDDAASRGPDGAPGLAGIDDDGDGQVDNNSELGWLLSDDGDFRDLGHPGSSGFYRAAACRNSFYSPPGNYRFDTWHPAVNLEPPGNVDLFVEPPPFRPALPGPDRKPGVANVNDNDPATTGPYGDNDVDNDAELGWPGSDDLRVPLKAIQIRITFFDPGSGNLRDSTMVISLRPK